jgi:hypothetical protein
MEDVKEVVTKKTPKTPKEPKAKKEVKNETVPVKKMEGKFTREFKDEDGITRTWFYDTDKFGMNPYKVEITYPEGYDYNDLKEDDNTLPKTKRKYLNPANGKMVGYTRARMLKLVD